MPATEPLYARDALRALETRGIEQVGGDRFELMRRAGSAAWRELLAAWPQAHRIVVACGPGNNGGDGYVLARHAQASGRDVQVLRLAEHAPRGDLARQACEQYLAAGGRIIEFDGQVVPCDLVVDALFGIGLSRAPGDSAAALIDAINACGAPVLALDVPSGLDADTGHAPGAVVRADATLEFIARHAGLYTGVAADCVGRLSLATLDLAPGLPEPVAPAALLLQPGFLATALPARPRSAHKGHNGHLLCIGGATGMGGAILLCAEAALRCGAGLVSVATQSANVPALLSRRPEAMSLAVDAPGELQPLLSRASVVAIGPGLGRDAWGRALFEAAAGCGKPRVLDADALFHLAPAPHALGDDVVLTPHPGEAARLQGDDGSAPPHDRFALAAELAARYRCNVVLKGAGSIVAAPGEIPRVIAAGNPGMASGGMGDVLTGTIAALRAQGLGAFDAACIGTLLHACAGDMAARDGGERGLLASDLMPCLRRLANP